jgi:peptide-methionine (S)-S-oxide reductase
MKDAEIVDPLFREAITAIDNGDVPALQQLLNAHPSLVRDRMTAPAEGYFKQPYLLWFIADNPIRRGKLHPNIVAIAQIIIQAVERNAADTLQYQLDYALGLVVTGSVPRDSGVQIQLMDILIDAGATPGKGLGAIAHGNLVAAAHLVERGGELTLAVAICLHRKDDVVRLLPDAGMADKQAALTAAAFYGNIPAIEMLLSTGVDVDAYLAGDSGFHSHATALHQAVYAGSLEAVKLLVNAGARLDVTDRVYGGTPLGWAIYMQTEVTDEVQKKKYAIIEDWLKNSSRPQ